MNSLFGLRLIQSDIVPAEVARVSVRMVKLKDGTVITTPEFLARENAWYREQFGTRQVSFIFQGPLGNGLVINPKHAAMLSDFLL
jgi:hypothetical protein